MPYMSVYGAFNGDTTVGGKNADPNVMADLGVSSLFAYLNKCR